MNAKILKLKQLSVAYRAALEFDYCPEEDKLNDVKELLITILTDGQISEALVENSGRRPDEIAMEIAEFIETDLE